MISVNIHCLLFVLRDMHEGILLIKVTDGEQSKIFCILNNIQQAKNHTTKKCFFKRHRIFS